MSNSQKLRETSQKARTEIENLDTLLAVRENDVTALKKEKEILKMEKEHLERRVDEVIHYFIVDLIFHLFSFKFWYS